MRPRRRILLRTISSIRGLKPYRSQTELRRGRNCPGAYFSSIKIARNTADGCGCPEKKLGKLIQGLDSCNPVAVKLDCGAWQSFSMIWYRDRAGTTLFHNELRRLSLLKSRIVKEHLCFQVGELPVLSIPEIEKVKSEWCYQFEIQLRPCATHLSKSVYSVC
jgi:hypothetical protein